MKIFSLFDFGLNSPPGDEHALPDHLSRPATEVCVLCLEDGQPRKYDLLTLGAWLRKHMDVVPSGPLVLQVLETCIQSELLTKVRQAPKRLILISWPSSSGTRTALRRPLFPRVSSAILAWPCVFDSSNVQKMCDKNHIPRATA